MGIGIPCFVVGIVIGALMAIFHWSDNGALFIHSRLSRGAWPCLNDRRGVSIIIIPLTPIRFW
jgi:hypothetical protein